MKRIHVRRQSRWRVNPLAEVVSSCRPFPVFSPRRLVTEGRDEDVAVSSVDAGLKEQQFRRF
jgi:hypothetical protein